MMGGTPGGQQGFDLSSAGGLYNPYAMATNMADGNMLSVLQDETTRTKMLLSGLIRSLKSRKS